MHDFVLLSHLMNYYVQATNSLHDHNR